MWNKKLHENSILSTSIIPNIICMCFCRVCWQCSGFYSPWKLLSFDQNWSLKSTFEWNAILFLWKSDTFQEKKKKKKSCEPSLSLIPLGGQCVCVFKIFCPALLLSSFSFTMLLTSYEILERYFLLIMLPCLITGSFTWDGELIPVFPNPAQCCFCHVARTPSHSWKPAEGGLKLHNVPCRVFCKNYSVLLEFCYE